MINLRDEAYRIMQEFGQYGLLIRNDIFQTCRCVDKISQAPDDNCPICLGQGVVNKVERILYRNKGVSSPAVLSKYLDYTTVGDISMVYTEFYFDFRVRPRPKDTLVVCDWSSSDPNVPQLGGYTQIYTLDYTEPLRADGGKIEYFLGLGKSDNINQKVRLHNVVKNARTYDYYITLRS